MPFAWVLLTQARGSLYYLTQRLFLFSWTLVRLRHEVASPPLPDGKPDPTISTSGSLRSSPLASTTVELLRSLSGCSRCCTIASSSRCMSSSMRALHSSECGFVTLSAPAARVAQAAHSGVGPYRAKSCFRMYLRLCCGVQTIDSGKSITTAGIGGGLTHPRNSSTSSDDDSSSDCWSSVFR